MHGYFLDLRLYTKAKAIANPFAYAEHRDKLIRDKLAKEQESRIRSSKKLSKLSSSSGGGDSVKVNKSLAKKLRQVEERQERKEAGIQDQDEDDEDKRRKRKRKADKAADQPSLLKDDRFGAIFENPDFEIDEESREFQLLNPSTKPNRDQANGDSDDDDSDASSRQGYEEASDSDSNDNEDEDDSDSDSSIGESSFCLPPISLSR
jgi:ribosome biogenesis protein ENP2